MADVRRVRVVVTGYYEVNMANAEEDYDTSDPTEMLAIDLDNAKLCGPAVFDSFGIEDLEVELRWAE